MRWRLARPSRSKSRKRGGCWSTRPSSSTFAGTTNGNWQTFPARCHLPQEELVGRASGEVGAPDTPCRPLLQSRQPVAFRRPGPAEAATTRSRWPEGSRHGPNAGLPVEAPDDLDEAQRERYSRHVLIPEVGLAGQRACSRRVSSLVGAGGLGSPALLYLAAAGIGRLGYRGRRRRRRVESPASGAALDRRTRRAEGRVRRGADPRAEPGRRAGRLPGAARPRDDRPILGDGWDVVVDGADNFPTRYLLNDASVWHGVPVVHGSIFRFEGQVTVFAPGAGPCYRCLFPQPPPPRSLRAAPRAACSASSRA